MAVSPLGNTIYVNQQIPFVATVRGDQLGRIEFQNVIAQQLLKEEEQKVQEVREPEENQAINPDREHRRQEADEEQEARKRAASGQAKEALEKESKSSEYNFHILDIKV